MSSSIASDRQRRITYNAGDGMELVQSNVLDAGIESQGFLDENGAKLGGVVTPLVRGQLDASVAQLAAFKSQQGSSKNSALGETAAQAKLRLTMYNTLLKQIATIADMALPGATDRLDLIASFELATEGRRGDFETAIDTALAAVTRYQQIFIDRGMPNVVKQLGDAIAQFKASFTAQRGHKNRRVGATSGLKAMETALRKTLVMIDSLVTPVLANDPDLLAQWQSSRRIKKTAASPNPTGTPVEQDTQGTQDTQNAPATPAPAAPTLTVATNKAA